MMSRAPRQSPQNNIIPQYTLSIRFAAGIIKVAGASCVAKMRSLTGFAEHPTTRVINHHSR